MKISVRRLYVLFIAGLLSACISPAEFEPESPDNILVVEGFIDNDFGPHSIQLTFLSPFTGVLEGGDKRIIDDANAVIIDDLGNYTDLNQESFFVEDLFNANPPGCVVAISARLVTTNYMTPVTFRGEVGRSYTLEIRLPGKVYRSTVQTMREPATIDSVFAQFVSLPGVDDLVETTGMDVFASFNHDQNESNYLWQLDGIYKIETPPIGGTACCLYDPRDDLGTSCWITELDINDNLMIADGDELSGNATQKAGFILDDGLRFASIEVPGDKQYYVNVKQYTISDDAYDFYSKVSVLSEINGEIFDPPPVGAKTNIFNVEDPAEKVVGFFGAFAKSERGFFIRRSQLNSINRTATCGDCRFFFPGQIEVPEVYQ